MFYKRVTAIGDSFTRGDELADCTDDQSVATHSNMTWPALVAKSINADYKCAAFGGKGNQWTSWQVAKKICNTYDYGNTNSLFIVNWSWFERFDYVNIIDDLWVTTHPRHDNKLDHYFYRNLDSDLWNLFRNLQQIHSTISLLKQHNIDFIMTCLDPTYNTKVKDFRPDSFVQNPEGQAWNKVIAQLQEQVLPYIIEFNGMSFLDWAKHNNYQFGPNGHPLEAAHAAAAEYIQERIKL